MLLIGYTSIIQDLSKSLTLANALEVFLHAFTQKLAQTIEADRVGVWKYNATDESIVLEYQFILSSHQVEKGMVIKGEHFPAYFKELKKENLIDAVNALTDPRTAEFNESYLIPLGIKSMLDIPFFKDGKLIGIICLEYFNQTSWKDEQKLFMRSMAELCSIAYMQEDLKKAFHTIELQKKSIEFFNENLENKVKDRTKELEERNKLLMEYAFINSHLLRGPICTLKGLVNLLNLPQTKDSEKNELIDKIGESVDKLNEISININQALEKGFDINRDEIRV